MSEDIEDLELLYPLLSEFGTSIGFTDEMLEGNEDAQVYGRSLVEFLWVEVGTDLDPCDGMSDGRDVVKLGKLGKR